MLFIIWCHATRATLFFSSARPTDDAWFKWKIFLTRKSKQKLFRFYLPYTSQASIQFLIIQPSQIPFYFFFILFWLRLRFNLPWISNLKKHLLCWPLRRLHPSLISSSFLKCVRRYIGHLRKKNSRWIFTDL